MPEHHTGAHAPKLSAFKRRPLAAALFSVVLSAGGAPLPVWAQAEMQATVSKEFHIAAGPLDAALDQFARGAGINLSYDADMVGDARTAGLQGRFGVADGLKALLAGTGLEAVERQGGGFVLRKSAAVLRPVKVSGSDIDGGAAQAYRVESASVGVLGDKSLFDTPYSVEVMSRELLDNKQAGSLNEALKGDASVSLTANNLGGLASQVAVRGIGLDLDNGRKVDGLNIFSWSSELPLEHFDSVQILKGAGGFLYGFAQPGGIVNYVSKRPTATPVRSLTTQITGSGTVLLHGDLGGRVGADDRFGYRVNWVNEQGDTYVKDGGKITRRSQSLALDWRLTPDLVWRFDALGQNRNVEGSTSWGLYPNVSGGDDYDLGKPPSPIDGDKRIYSPFTRYETRATIYGTELGWHWNDDWFARLSYRESSMDRIYLNGAINANAEGDYTESQYAGTDRFKSEQVQALVTGRAETGVVRHDLAFGLSHSKNRGYSSEGAFTLLGSGNLAHPGDFPDQHLHAPAVDSQFSEVTQRALFASDTLHLGEQWDVIVGLRRNAIKDAFNGYDRSAWTPTFAVINRPLPWLSVYGSYVESLEQGAIAPISGVTNPRETFEPLKSKQLEAGAKIERDRWSANAALFRIERGLAYTTAEGRFTQNGEARFDGFELGGKFRLSDAWLLNASAMLLRAENTKTEPAIEGERVAGAPREQVSAYAEYSLPGTALVLSAGGQYYGERFIDAANHYRLPGYTLLDAGARYGVQLGAVKTTLRLNVDNLGNKAYWLTSASNLIQGAPRTVKLSAQFEF